MLSNTTKYATRAVIYLAIHAGGKQRIGLKEISGELDIPLPFLGKIMQMLVKQGILTSVKGPHGGFSLARSPVDISLMDIIEIIEGEDVFEKCLIRTSKCSEHEPCSLHDKISPARRELSIVLRSESIADLASQYISGNKRIRI